MKKHSLAFIFIVFVSYALAVQSQNPQKTATGTSPFAGRWEIQTIEPSRPPEQFAIIEFEPGPAGISGKIIALAIPASGPSIKLGDIFEKEGQLNFVIEVSTMGMSMGIKFQGKRVGDHLEGTADLGMGMGQLNWTAQMTTKDKFEQPEDKKAFDSAMMKPPAERAEALRQFLKNFPESSLKDQAIFYLTRTIQKPEERIAALRKFLQDFPGSSLKEQASLLLAESLQDPSEKTAALRKFLADFPTSPIKDKAEYELIAMISDPNERLAAQEKFVKDYPKSGYAGDVYLVLLDARLRAKPLDEAKTNEIIDGYIGSTPDSTGPAGQFGLIARANVLNTIADRLMVNEVLLDKALDLIQKAVVLSEKIPAQFPGISRFKTMCQTTLGQVYFKRKDYDQAEKELKKAIEMAGKEGVAEAHLFLGKIYEARNNDDAALDSYLNAAALGSSAEIKSSLERAYRKKYGNLDGLEAKLDAIYLARPKPFDPGHYAPTGKESGRVVLAELFTGSECPPCVAADQAFDGLAERYDRNMVAVLVYHLHIPGPDPMTNPDTESRAKYYEVGSTPIVIIDGVDKQVGGGSSAQSPMVFNNYKGKIEARLSKPPLAVFTDLKAKIEGQTLTVTGQVNLAPEVAGKAEKARLRIALVLDVVRYTGGNGVRFHNFVVRKFIGPPVGWPLEQPGTKTSFSESVNIATLGDNQREYLTKYENEIAGKFRPGFKFHEKLDRIEPARLLIIAFVQDDQTKEILQAYFVKPGS
jgi:TolA-binding protein/thiol-disulfide isomerase/thioredoxin